MLFLLRSKSWASGQTTLASTSLSRRTSSSSPSTLISVPPYFEYRTSSPSATSSGTRLPVSSLILPSPTARTLPFCGFSFAVSGRTMPDAVVSSSSRALTIRRSPRGLRFMPDLHLRSVRSHGLALQGGGCHPRQSTSTVDSRPGGGPAAPGARARLTASALLPQLVPRDPACTEHPLPPPSWALNTSPA